MAMETFIEAAWGNPKSNIKNLYYSLLYIYTKFVTILYIMKFNISKFRLIEDIKNIFLFFKYKNLYILMWATK